MLKLRKLPLADSGICSVPMSRMVSCSFDRPCVSPAKSTVKAFEGLVVASHAEGIDGVVGRIARALHVSVSAWLWQISACDAAVLACGVVVEG
jgi:hypothetical protein